MGVMNTSKNNDHEYTLTNIKINVQKHNAYKDILQKFQHVNI